MKKVLSIAIRPAGALALAAVLLILLASPARSDIRHFLTDEFSGDCIILGDSVWFVRIPDLTSFGFNGIMKDGPSSLSESGDTAMLVGVATDPSSTIGFDILVRISGRESCVVPDIPDDSDHCDQPETYVCASSLSGKLVGRSGSIFDGAVYTLTPRVLDPQTGEESVVLFGLGAFQFNASLGVRGEFSAQLDDPVGFPSLPAGPISGDFRFVIDAAVIEIPSASAGVIGTWEGTLDCIGQQGVIQEVVSTSDTSTPATLLIASGGAELKEGVGSNAELNGKTYCVNMPASSDGSGNIEGQLASPATLEPQGYVKSDDNTLKLRLLRSAGQMVNIDFCKGEFTRTNSAEPGVVVAGGCGTINEIAPNGCTDSSVAVDTNSDGRVDAFLSCEEAYIRQCAEVVCGPGTICRQANGGSIAMPLPIQPTVCIF